MSKLESAELLRLRQTGVGHKVNIPHASVFRFTNIFIDESKHFMPRTYPPSYRSVPVRFSVIVAVLSFGGAATLTWAIIFLIFGFPFITIYWQNEQVNRKSLPLVKKQSVKNDQQTLNALYEVTFEEHHHPIHHINLYSLFAPLRLRNILTDERYGSPIFFHISIRNPKNVSTKMFYLYLQSSSVSRLPKISNLMFFANPVFKVRSHLNAWHLKIVQWHGWTRSSTTSIFLPEIYQFFVGKYSIFIYNPQALLESEKIRTLSVSLTLYTKWGEIQERH